MDDTQSHNTSNAEPPLVCVGLVVYNGENYLRQSIQSILDQTFDDFELVISDNCSTDGTEGICREFAASSNKIRYFRQSQNMGSSANFEFVYQQSRSKYFKWHCHDDYAHPEYLEKCVARLEAEPDAVLCQAHVALVDAKGENISVYAPEEFGTTDPDPIKRFAGRLRSVFCTEVFGVMRRDVLEQTDRLGPFMSHDRCLLAQLTLIGRFLVVPEDLFAFRIHPEQYTQAVSRRDDVMSWYAPSLAHRPRLPSWTHLSKCAHYLATVDLNTWTRIRGYAALIRSQSDFTHLRTLFREARRVVRYGTRRLLGRITAGSSTA